MINPEEQHSAPVPATPRPFREIPGLWLRLPVMTEDFFRLEAARASDSNTFLTLIVYCVLAAGLCVALTLMDGLLNPLGILGAAQLSAGKYTAGLILYMSLMGGVLLFITPLGFYSYSGLAHLAAR